MKGIHATLLAIGTGIVGIGIGAIAAGAIVGIGATVGGAIGGSMLGICMTTDAAINSGLINEQQLEQLATRISETVMKEYPELAKPLKEADYKSQLQNLANLGSDDQPSANCDRLLENIFTQIGQAQ